MRSLGSALAAVILLAASPAAGQDASDRAGRDGPGGGSAGVATDGRSSSGVASGGATTGGSGSSGGAGVDGRPRVQETPPRPSLFEADWEDRRGWVLEGAAGSTFTFAGRSSSRGYDTDLTGLAVLGVHRMIDYRSSRHEKGDFPEVEGTRWCVPIMCGGLGMLVAPPGVVTGDEIGVDLRFNASPTVARGAVRLFSRYGRGKLRTISLAGFMLPEVGLQRGRYLEGPETSLTLGWSIFPVDVLLTEHVAIGVDPLRVGMVIGLDRQAFRTEGASELAVRFTM